MKKRTSLPERRLPKYSQGEEIFNMVTHIVGGATGVCATVLCVIIAAIKGNSYGVVSGALFGASIIILYAMSSIYHGLKRGLVAKKVFQIFDHCTIFILIAGTYTPICLCSMRAYNPAMGWVYFGIIWGLAIIGIIFNSIDLKKYRIWSLICYLGMGWCIIIKANLLPTILGWGGVYLLIGGGVFYTVGAIFYVLGKKYKWLHSIFHIGCVIGTILHVLCILFYVL